MTRKFLAVLVALLAVTLAAVFALPGAQTKVAQSQRILPSAVAAEGDLLSPVGPNTTLHGVGEVFRRHGPIADLLAAEHDEFYQPESTIIEGWTTFDAAGNLASRRSEIRGLDGKLYQETWWEDGEVVSRDVVLDSERRMPFPDLANLTAASFSERALKGTQAEYDKMMDAAATTVREAVVAGEPVWVIERELPVRHGNSDTPSEPPHQSPASEEVSLSGLSYTIPYVADLDLVGEVIRWTIRQSDNFLLLDELIGIDADGREHVLESMARTVYEVILR